jgi:predicted RNase H-like nuclease
MFFVGIDLAWSDKNNSAISIIEAEKEKGELKYFNYKIRKNEDIVDWVTSKIGNNYALIAIDAPLIIPNEKGMRIADKLTTKLFRRYNAGTHPANREHLRKYGGLRGEALVNLFEKQGYKHNPYIKPRKKLKAIIEVYPHPAIVVLFNLSKIIQYKPRGNRNYKFRWNEFKRLQEYIISLEDYKPSLKIQDKYIKRDITKLKGNSLKEFEDFLDSIICAYVAHYYWYWGLERCAILGDLENGYIVTPIFDWMKDILRQKQAKLW